MTDPFSISVGIVGLATTALDIIQKIDNIIQTNRENRLSVVTLSKRITLFQCLLEDIKKNKYEKDALIAHQLERFNKLLKEILEFLTDYQRKVCSNSWGCRNFTYLFEFISNEKALRKFNEELNALALELDLIKQSLFEENRRNETEELKGLLEDFFLEAKNVVPEDKINSLIKQSNRCEIHITELETKMDALIQVFQDHNIVFEKILVKLEDLVPLTGDETQAKEATLRRMKIENSDLTFENTDIKVGSFGCLTQGWLQAQFKVSIKSVNHSQDYNHVEDELFILQHLSTSPYIFRCFGYTTEGKFTNLVFERVRFGSLDDVLKSHSFFPEFPFPLVIAWIFDISNAVSYIHSKGVKHRDICPLNILVTENFHLKIFEFGHARMSSSYRDSIHSSGYFNFVYQAPEALKGIPNFASDVYSLGATIISIITRSDPNHEKRIDHLNLALSWKVEYEPLREILTSCIQSNYKDRCKASDVVDVVSNLRTLMNLGDPRENGHGIQDLLRSLERFENYFLRPFIPFDQLSTDELKLLWENDFGGSLPSELNGKQVIDLIDSEDWTSLIPKDAPTIVQLTLFDDLTTYINDGVPIMSLQKAQNK